MPRTPRILIHGRDVKTEHREKWGASFGIPAMIARPVTKKEHATTGVSLEAEEAEWRNHAKRGVFDMDSVREWSVVANEARRRGEEIHMGRVFGFAVVKHSEFD